MPYEVFEKNYKVHWITEADGGIDDMEAPTEGEIAAGTRVVGIIASGGVQLGSSDNRVSVADIDTGYAGQIFGTYGNELALTIKRESATDAMWDLFQERKTQGFLVVSPFGDIEVGSKVHVFACENGSRQLANAAENEQQTFTVPFACPIEPALDAVVAAGS